MNDKVKKIVNVLSTQSKIHDIAASNKKYAMEIVSIALSYQEKCHYKNKDIVKNMHSIKENKLIYQRSNKQLHHRKNRTFRKYALIKHTIKHTARRDIKKSRIMKDKESTQANMTNPQ